MLYKPSLIDKTNTEYLVEVYEDKFNEGVVEDFLNCRSNKRSILKSILVDKNEIIDSNTSRSTLTSKSSVNNLSDFNKKESKKNFNILETSYFFIYEDDPLDENLYEYNVIKVKKDNATKDSFINDFISKLNDFQQTFTLTYYFSEENSIYFFMTMPINSNQGMMSSFY